MKKMITAFALVLGLMFATSAQAGINGLGWDAGKSQLTLRTGSLDLGIGNMSSDSYRHPTLSITDRLSSLASSENFNAYTVVGADYSTRRLDAFVGVMPEIVFSKHLAFSTKFGANIPVYNHKLDVSAGLAGSPISLSTAVNFMVLF